MVTRGIACLFRATGAMVLPAKTEYEMDLVMEHVAASARRDGRVKLEFNGHQWLVTGDVHATEFCARCHKELISPRFEDQWHETSCSECTRERLRTRSFTHPRRFRMAS